MKRSLFDRRHLVRFLKIRRSCYAYLVVVLFIFVIVCWQLAPLLRVFALNAQEDIAYALFPSAARAYAYGDVHFNVADPADYDIQRAQTYFYRAAALDPKLPYVYHQLARISFLNGDFLKALAQINVQLANHGDSTPQSYYVRGLIEGYMGDYPDAELDYAHFLKLLPVNWPGWNDYAWVLLKDNKPAEAADATAHGLAYYPNNPWLLNTRATALYEMGDIAQAKQVVAQAQAAVANLTPSEWSAADPGNDPNVAPQGVAAFKAAVAGNMHTIEAATTSMSR